ncbi:cytochrome c [Oxalobacteraceae bacterium CAVE-383]|nr:cytochrome c [Oxalobacteraceae bacterium CAVE-383]
MNNLKLQGLLMALGLMAAGASVAQSAQSPQVKRGGELWEKNGCYMCHGTVGQGGVGPAVAVDLVPFAAVNAYVRHPNGDMPPYAEGILSDADLHDIYAYLGAQPQPKSPDGNKLLPKVAPMSSQGKMR